jgi:hypothetical protein
MKKGDQVCKIKPAVFDGLQIWVSFSNFSAFKLRTNKLKTSSGVTLTNILRRN